MTLLSIVGASMIGVLSRQQRFYRGTGDIIEVRTQLRQAIAVVGNDLRNVSSAGGDIVGTLSDSAIDFRYTIGSSIVCAKAGSQIVLPPLSLASGAVLSSWVSIPTTTDTAYIFNEGADTTTSTDDTWSAYPITAATTLAAGTCPINTGYVAAADAAKSSFTVTLGSSVSGNIRVGAAVRFVRRAHYSLYQSTSDNLWYLGYCSLACGGGNTITAVAGPFNAYAASGAATSGIRFTYYDSTGATATTGTNVARVNILLRGTSRGYVNIEGITKGYYVDSVRTDVAIRNRS